MNKRIKTKINKKNQIQFLIEMVGNNTNNQFYLQKQIESMSIEIKQLQNQISDLNEFNNLRFSGLTQYQKSKKILMESELY